MAYNEIPRVDGGRLDTVTVGWQVLDVEAGRALEIVPFGETEPTPRVWLAEEMGGKLMIVITPREGEEQRLLVTLDGEIGWF